MATIDHPLLEANRAIESGFLDPEALDRAVAEWRAGPQTPARMRECVFEILGPGFRGCLPIAIMEILDPETVLEGLGIAKWLAIGPIDDASVLEIAGGDWFGIGKVDATADRPMVGFVVDEDSARWLGETLAEGRRPVWAIPATDLLPLGTEREFRAFMDVADDGSAS